MSIRSLAVVLLSAMFCGSAFATPVTVGTGNYSASIFVQWSNGYEAQFVVNFDSNFGEDHDANPTGFDLLHVLDDSLDNFSINWNYGGTFNDGMTFVDAQSVTHSNVGYIPEEGWWHYYKKNLTTGNWDFSLEEGCADRIISNGDSDKWIYPIPEPMTMALLGLGGIFAARRRK